MCTHSPEVQPHSGTAFQHIKGAQQKRETDILQWQIVIGQRRRGFQLKQERFSLDVKKNFFTVTVVRIWISGCPERLQMSHPRSVQGQGGWGPE